MIKVVVRDMNERVFFENEVAENITIYDLKKHLVLVVQRDISSKHVSESTSAPEITKETLSFRVFYNKKAIREDIPVSAFGSPDKEVCLHFEITELLRSQSITAREERSDVELQEVEIEDTTENTQKKIKICVDEKNIIHKNGRSYLIVHKKEKSKAIRLLKRAIQDIPRDLVLKLSIITFLAMTKNAEIAFILAAISFLRFAGSRKVWIRSEAENAVALILKTVFLFFYTMFIISAEDGVLMA